MRAILCGPCPDQQLGDLQNAVLNPIAEHEPLVAMKFVDLREHPDEELVPREDNRQFAGS